jgi:hypothetical protein
MGRGLPSVVGQILSPRPFYSFPNSFSFLFCFLFIFGLKNFYKTSVLNFGQLLDVVNLSLCCLNIEGRFWFKNKAKF